MTIHAENDGFALLGVDVGGTFTDAVLVTASGVSAVKTLTTPDQSVGVIAALRACCVQAALEPTAISRFAHGTTVATNALLERTGAPTAAVFTAGFEDLLEIARQDRPHLFRPHVPRAAPLVDRARCVGVAERLDQHGKALVELNEEECARVASQLAALDVQSVAICLLHAYANPAHERKLAAAIRAALPELHVVASHEISRELREYERATTTTIDATLTPVVAPYLGRLARRCAEAGVPAPWVMQSNGGLDAATEVERHAARSVLSGPAGGLVAAQRLAQSLGVEQLICFDMGGTSCDVATVRAEALDRGSDHRVAGLPLQLEIVDMHTIGAGGSSIASVDAGGALQVGPRSAGSAPGPAAYARGGTDPTVTDAHVVLGNLAPDTLAHWNVPLDIAAAERALASLGLGAPDEVARGILDVVSAAMAEAVRVVTAARGDDPNGMALLAYGGAGGLHACDVAARLGCSTVLVPATAGMFSAHGLALADVRRERSRTLRVRANDSAGIEAAVRWITDTALELSRQLTDESAPPTTVELTAELRYAGQGHTLADRRELVAPVTERATRQAVLSALDSFGDLHHSRYGFDLSSEVELVTARVAAVSALASGDFATATSSPQSSPSLLDQWRERTRDTADGARAIDLAGGTVLVSAGWRVDEHGPCLRLTHERAGA